MVDLYNPVHVALKNALANQTINKERAKILASKMKSDQEILDGIKRRIKQGKFDIDKDVAQSLPALQNRYPQDLETEQHVMQEVLESGYQIIELKDEESGNSPLEQIVREFETYKDLKIAYKNLGKVKARYKYVTLRDRTTKEVRTFIGRDECLIGDIYKEISHIVLAEESAKKWAQKSLSHFKIFGLLGKEDASQDSIRTFEIISAGEMQITRTGKDSVAYKEIQNNYSGHLCASVNSLLAAMTIFKYIPFKHTANLEANFEITDEGTYYASIKDDHTSAKDDTTHLKIDVTYPEQYNPSPLEQIIEKRRGTPQESNKMNIRQWEEFLLRIQPLIAQDPQEDALAWARVAIECYLSLLKMHILPETRIKYEEKMAKLRSNLIQRFGQKTGDKVLDLKHLTKKLEAISAREFAIFLREGRSDQSIDYDILLIVINILFQLKELGLLSDSPYAKQWLEDFMEEKHKKQEPYEKNILPISKQDRYKSYAA
jgi:hypothetical protein